jgi:hypothetical protein
MSEMLRLGCDSVGLPRGHRFARRMPWRLLCMCALAVHKLELEYDNRPNELSRVITPSSLTRVNRAVLQTGDYFYYTLSAA